MFILLRFIDDSLAYPVVEVDEYNQIVRFDSVKELREYAKRKGYRFQTVKLKGDYK